MRTVAPRRAGLRSIASPDHMLFLYSAGPTAVLRFMYVRVPLLEHLTNPEMLESPDPEDMFEVTEDLLTENASLIGDARLIAEFLLFPPAIVKI